MYIYPGLPGLAKSRSVVRIISYSVCGAPINVRCLGGAAGGSCARGIATAVFSAGDAVRCLPLLRMDESRPEVDCLSQAPGPIGGEDVNLHATVGGWEEASRRHDCRQRIVVSGGRWPVASPLVARSAAGLHPCVAAAGADDFVSGHHNLQGCEPPWWRVGGVVGRWWVGAVPVVTCAGGLARGLTVGPSRCCSACPRWRGPKCGC